MNDNHLHKIYGDILIVDDELPNLQMLSDLLIAQGHEVRGAKNGRTALDFIAKDQPDLILLDVRMPDMDGFKVCRRLKSDRIHRDIPIIFLSALLEPEDKIRGFEAGAVDFITKPFQAEEVLVRVDTHLSLSRLHKNLEQQVEKRTAELIKSQEELSAQIEFERLIADIAAHLAQTSPEQLDVSIDSTLQSLGRFLHTERSFLGHFSEDGNRLVFTNIWAVEGLSLRSQIFKMEMVSDIPWVAQQILNGRVIKAGPRLTGLPDEAQKLRSQLEHDGINSGVVVPVRVEGRSIGLLGLDTIAQPREYPPPIVDRLRIVADIIGSTLRHAKSHKTLQDSVSQIKQLKSRIEQENVYLREEIELQHRHGEIIGKSQAVRQMLIQAEQVARTDSTVLILGETGTGKELLARAIHRMSSRNHRPMITVNCAALPATLIESEMFGREKGAFTGALSGRIGRFEVADGSTFFLDEIGELKPDIQIKLLRVIEKGHFERLGSNKTVKVDVRIIAATNRDLVKAVHEGSFRRDLYYRLNVFPIRVPSLQDRLDDLELLVWSFVKEYGERMGKRVETIPSRSIEALKTCPWRGNVRELRNVIEQSMIITQGPTLSVQLPGTQEQRENQAVLLKDVERNHILKILKQTGWRVRGKAGAAELLGLKPTTLDARMNKLGVLRPK